MADLRPLDLDDPREVRQWADLTASVFLAPKATDKDLATLCERMRTTRTTVVQQDGRLIGSFGSFDTTVSLPGGSLVTANAIGGIVVAPMHKRRGVLTRWLLPELARAKASGAAMSVLHASAATIYGRFGFGPVTGGSSWDLDVRRTGFRAPSSGELEFVEPVDARSLVDEIYTRAQSRCAGSIARRSFDWEDILEARGRNAHPEGLWCVLHRDASGTPDGLVVYRVKDSWDEGVESATLTMVDLVAATQEAERALWEHCASVDFVTRVVHRGASPDLPLPHWLVDPRAASSGPIRDGMWARIHNVSAALKARRYPSAGLLSFEVTDPQQQTSGRYMLLADVDGTGKCVRLPGTGSTDFVIGIGSLATLLFGCPTGTPSLEAMLHSTDIQFSNDASASRVMAMFSVHERRWSLTEF